MIKLNNLLNFYMLLCCMAPLSIAHYIINRSKFVSIELQPYLTFSARISLSEHYIYGSSRLGTRMVDKELYRNLLSYQGLSAPLLEQAGLNLSQPAYNMACGCVEDPEQDSDEDEDSEQPGPGLPAYAHVYRHRLGYKQYELTNHLGNVLATVLDRRTGQLLQPSDTAYAWYQADVPSAQDYYPFGMQMPGRTYVADTTNLYRYMYGGHEKVDEVTGAGNTIDMGDRWLDVRLGRTPKMDRQANKFAGVSPYSYALNNPIIYIDPDGEYPISIHVRSFAPFNYFGPGNLWKGDGSNRSFTTNYAGSRISMVTNYETETQVANSKAMGAMSFSKYGARAYSDAYLNNGQRSVTTMGNSWDLHLYGKNEALIPPGSPLGWSPGGRFTPTSDIDIHNRLSINATDGALSITGQITGDQFPSAEAFVSDDFGTSLLLGTFATSGGRQMGPVKDLAGDRDLPMINVNIKLSVGENGAFQGVYSTDSNGNEIIMSPDAWNKQFESQSTTR